MNQNKGINLSKRIQHHQDLDQLKKQNFVKL